MISVPYTPCEIVGAMQADWKVVYTIKNTTLHTFQKNNNKERKRNNKKYYLKIKNNNTQTTQVC